MFSQKDDTAISYHYGTEYQRQPLYLPFTLKQKFANNALLSAFTVVRSNCEEACSQKLLADLSDELKQEYRDNSKIAQVSLKSKNDSTQVGLDSCIRRCFGKKLDWHLFILYLFLNWIVKRLNSHFGKEVQDYVYATAFEYQQQDFHYFDINNVNKQPRIKKLKFPESDFEVADKIINNFSA